MPPPPPPKRRRAAIATPRQPQKKRRSGWLTFLAVIFIALPFAAGGVYLYIEHERESREEAEAYQAIAAGGHDMSQLRDYLDRFPNGENSPRVRQRMRELQEIEADWRDAVADDTPDAFVNFKNRHRDPYYDRLADQKIDSLDYVYAVAENTSEAFTRYLSQHPNGTYRSKAMHERNNIENQRFEQRRREAEIMNYLFGTKADSTETRL